MAEQVVIEKLVYGGQGLATMSDGRKAFVWNALPEEEVLIETIKKRRDYIEAIATKVVQSSADRVAPLEQNFLSTSPWQIMNYQVEVEYKKDILHELYTRQGIKLDDFKFVHHASISADSHDLMSSGFYHYRNKMEYSFWGDDDGLHLALFKRGSHHKQIVTGSKLAIPAIDAGAKAVLSELQAANVRASQLKTLILRASQTGEVVASLFVKDQDFTKINLPPRIKGMKVYYSNPKSPASVRTQMLYSLGEAVTSDALLDRQFVYNSDSFFQVNLPIFNQVLDIIKQHVGNRPVIDMYGGVGSIGLSVSNSVTIVDSDESSIEMAKRNAVGATAQVILATAESALQHINSQDVLIVDPPRAGLHKQVVDRIINVAPPVIIYLSCNPSTQARDLKLLTENYEITFFEGYNFFPRTPHIEALAILQLKEPKTGYNK